MRLTQILHFLNATKPLTKSQEGLQYTHFVSSEEDRRLRTEYKNTEEGPRKKNVLVDLFE